MAWQEQSLRPQGSPWPGLNTRGGRLDNGSGQLEDGSINCQINQADILSKRRGFVRGIDEWFGSVVCGLFTYQDYCGNEYLLVADEEQINIRQLFELPQFTASDAYPNDTFDGDGAINVSAWRNTSRYVRAQDRMVQALGAAAFTGPRLADDLFMRWFKDAGSLAYQVRVDYRFDASLSAEQRVGAVIRGNGDLSGGALLQADVVFRPDTGVYELQLFHRLSDGTYQALLTQEIDGVTTDPFGTITLEYQRDLNASTYVPRVTIAPNLGTFRELEAPSLTTVQDADLGLVSGLAVGQAGGTVSQSIGVELVTGGPI